MDLIHKLVILGMLSTTLVVCQDERTKEDDVQYANSEHRLKQKLLKDYDKDVFPTKSHNHTLKVDFGIALVQLSDVDEGAEIITLNTWLTYAWDDFRLSWEPAEYDGLNVIRLNSAYVWIPDITLFNNANDDLSFKSSDVSIIVYSSGRILWIPPRKIRAWCPFDLTNFPYDQHQCTLKFGSWTFDGYQLDLNFYEGKKGIDLSEYAQQSEWEVSKMAGFRNNKYYDCCPEPYPDLSFNVTLTRNPTFYVHCFVSPAVILFLLIPFIFLPKPGNPGSIIKNLLGIGILICCTMIVTVVMGLPSFSKRLPRIMIHYISILVLTGFSLILSYFIDVMYDTRARWGPPSPLRMFFISCIGKVVRVQVEDFSDNQSNKTSSDDANDQEKMVDVKSAIRSQWQALAVVISRLLFLIFLIIFSLVLPALFG